MGRHFNVSVSSVLDTRTQTPLKSWGVENAFLNALILYFWNHFIQRVWVWCTSTIPCQYFFSQTTWPNASSTSGNCVKTSEATYDLPNFATLLPSIFLILHYIYNSIDYIILAFLFHVQKQDHEFRADPDLSKENVFMITVQSYELIVRGVGYDRQVCLLVKYNSLVFQGGGKKDFLWSPCWDLGMFYSTWTWGLGMVSSYGNLVWCSQVCYLCYLRILTSDCRADILVRHWVSLVTGWDLQYTRDVQRTSSIKEISCG